jgi:hypothetical protein
MTRNFQATCRATGVGLAVALGFLAAPIHAGQFQLRWDHSNSTVSADISEAPVRQVLEQIQIATGWDVFVEPGFNSPISTTFTDLKTGRALSRLLGNANFAVVPGDNKSTQLMVFRTSKDSATEKLLVGAIDPEDVRRIEDELLITVGSKEEAEKVAKEFGAEIIGEIPEMGAYRLKFKDAESADMAKAELEKRNGVKVDSNYEISRPQNAQPLMGSQVPLPQIRAGNNAGNQLVIGVVDTAIQVPGGPLGDFFLTPISIDSAVTPNGEVPTHATSMANDILFSMEAIVGMGGAANAKILSVDVFGGGTDTTTFQLGQGLVQAWNNGATLINASLGSKAPSPWLDAIINQLTAQGALILGPSGNVPDGLPTYPAANPNMLAVTATAPGGGYASYANVAPFVDVSMPGNSIVTLTGRAYFVSGTSSATAKATGSIAGYMLQTGGTPQDGRRFLIQARGIR